MTQETPPRQRLQEIFFLTNRSSLPAMTDHVTEFIALLDDDNADSEALASVILKDCALSGNILKMVNSVHYSRGAPIGTISRAVSAVGRDTIRHLAVTMALFEFLLAAGEEKEEIAGTFALSVLSAIQARLFCGMKKPGFSPEEAYVCSLLHNLGKIVVLVYLPGHSRLIAQKIRQGYSEEHSCRQALNGLTYSQIGQEMATFWGFPKRIVACMETAPARPGRCGDSFLILQNLVVFSNRLAVSFFHGSDLDLADLVLDFGPLLGVSLEESLALVDRSLAICETFSDAMREMLEKVPNRAGTPAMVQKDGDGRWSRVR